MNLKNYAKHFTRLHSILANLIKQSSINGITMSIHVREKNQNILNFCIKHACESPSHSHNEILSFEKGNVVSKYHFRQPKLKEISFVFPDGESIFYFTP